MSGRNRASAALMLFASLAACGQTRADRDLARQSLVLSAVSEEGAGAAAAPLAGVSARARVQVQPLNRRRLGPDTMSHGFHRYLQRCFGCHARPAPGLHTAAEWAGVLDRMDSNMAAAGLLRLSREDRMAILRFLGAHSRSGG
ncbi:MAG: hypothetical protein HY703_02730 [Gemmatimonadetes bacterium]|nr:hypothetical protein [Gemmatimonadota bacterium]